MSRLVSLGPNDLQHFAQEMQSKVEKKSLVSSAACESISRDSAGRIFFKVFKIFAGIDSGFFIFGENLRQS